MRILQISSARSIGGGERHLAELANALSARGHQVFAALPSSSQLRKELGALPAQNIFNVRLHNALDIGSAFELARLVRRERIDIVHAHVARDYPLAALATKRNRQTRLIITRHVLFPLNGLHSVALAHVARVIGVSRAVERTLLAQKIFPAHKVSVIPNGIDFGRLDARTPQFNRDELRRRLNIGADTLLVGTVGELKRQKGHEDFLRAAAIIARARPDVHFIIAGGDTTRTGGHRETLEQLAAELRLSDRVHLLGWLDDVGSLLASLDVYVSASRTESFGLALVEAMAAGLSVVATATEGAKEIIGSESAGVIVPVGDVEALASSTIRLIESPVERARIGEVARSVARTRFNLERMVDETEKVYLEAMNAKR